MHSCLRIPEILSNIFSYIFDSPPSSTVALAYLAITCRDFREPALDLLWRSQSSLSSLIKCLPSDAILKEDVSDLDRSTSTGMVSDGRPFLPQVCAHVILLAPR